MIANSCWSLTATDWLTDHKLNLSCKEKFWVQSLQVWEGKHEVLLSDWIAEKFLRFYRLLVLSRHWPAAMFLPKVLSQCCSSGWISITYNCSKPESNVTNATNVTPSQLNQRASPQHAWCLEQFTLVEHSVWMWFKHQGHLVNMQEKHCII